MTGAGLSKAGLARMDEVLERHTIIGGVDGLAWAVARRGERHVGWAGIPEPRRAGEVAEDTIFRISSMTKPVVAVAALQLVEDCTLRLDEPVDELLPELADRQVIRRADGPIDDTVPADRPISLRDLLTFRAGMGMDFAFTAADRVQRDGRRGPQHGAAPAPAPAAGGRVDAGDGRAPARAPARRAVAVQHRGGRPRRARGAGHRPPARGGAAPAHLRTPRHDRHGVLGPGRQARAVRQLRRHRGLRHQQAGRVRSARGPVGHAAGLPIGSRWARVDDRGLPRLRRDAASGRRPLGRAAPVARRRSS